MDNTASLAPRSAPAHLWVVGVTGLSWNGFGAFDYVMTNIRDHAYLARFSAGFIQMIDEFPLWVMAAWAFGVWGAVAGSLLLLRRSRLAVHAFAVSLAGLAGSSAYRAALDSTGISLMNLLIWIAAVFFLLYAIRQRRTGVLG